MIDPKNISSIKLENAAAVELYKAKVDPEQREEALQNVKNIRNEAQYRLDEMGQPKGRRTIQLAEELIDTITWIDQQLKAV